MKIGTNIEKFIIGEHIILKQIDENYTNLILKWRNSSDVKKNFIFKDNLTTEMHRNWLETSVKTGKAIQYIIINRNNDMPIGSVYFRNVDLDNGIAEYGVFIGEPQARGYGFGTETAILFSRFGFEVLGLNRIVLRVFADNINAVNCYFKAGYKIFNKIIMKENKNNRLMFIMHKYKDVK